MGAWIETSLKLIFLRLEKVAPYMGAWIETGIGEAINQIETGRSLYGSVD